MQVMAGVEGGDGEAPVRGTSEVHWCSCGCKEGVGPEGRSGGEC